MVTEKDNIIPAIDDEGYLVDPDTWDEQVAEWLAAREALELTEEHWAVLYFMRRYYEAHQIAPDARYTIQFLADEKGYGRKARNHLFKLFPYGYVQQGCKVAGMKRPRAWSSG